MPRKIKVPAQRWRTIRGGIGNYDVAYFDTKAERDEAAQKFADLDTETVLLEVWSTDHPQDSLNEGWASDATAYPKETA